MQEEKVQKTLANDEGYVILVEEERPLSNDAAGGAVSRSIGVDGGGRFRCHLGLWVGGEEGEKGIHGYVRGG